MHLHLDGIEAAIEQPDPGIFQDVRHASRRSFYKKGLFPDAEFELICVPAPGRRHRPAAQRPRLAVWPQAPCPNGQGRTIVAGFSSGVRER